MFDSLLWVLYHFVTHYAGQTTQGDKNDGGSANQASGSKDATSSLQGTTPTTLPTTLQEGNTPDQSGASSSADPQPERIAQSEAKPYLRDQKTDQYDAFIASEINPPPICHLRNSLVPSEETSVAQCMSSRPPNLLLSYELLLQMYLSRPGHENPYVPTTFDYITLKKKYILVMEYFGGSWVTLFNYVEGKERPDIVDARDIIKKIVEAMIHLKQYGILHLDVQAGNVMYNPKTRKIKLLDFGVSAVLPGWEGGKSLPLKSPDLSSTSPGYKAGDDELISMKRFGQLIYATIISKDALPDISVMNKK
ncbi:hypothetical protein BASA50_002736 [Batrachochytrium salamandrivorans]|uniref:Protein kinase domain-containing protein n=1 Tax=Batrachochytrium salamandrivorans TaxID=1357716 RepID=A0ABQ8FKJ6_9FUNG|nr:hypothetical protein BASA50_002736 [Batrachochytrium salamandrivorans]